MARKKRTPEENARREKIRELLQMANIGSMEDIQSLFKETIDSFKASSTKGLGSFIYHYLHHKTTSITKESPSQKSTSERSEINIKTDSRSRK